MPTGYTAAIADDITFNDFVMNCSRAMGALILMRDEPSNAPIPERFEPTDYHAKKIEAAKAKLLELQGLSEAETIAAAQAAFDEETEARDSAMRKNDSLREKYTAMLGQVKAWETPTPDHDGFKTFMVEQITGSIDFDCSNSYYIDRKPVLLSGDAWLAREMISANKDLEYHTAENLKEIERTEGRNKWLRELRVSLKGSNNQGNSVAEGDPTEPKA